MLTADRSLQRSLVSARSPMATALVLGSEAAAVVLIGSQLRLGLGGGDAWSAALPGGIGYAVVSVLLGGCFQVGQAANLARAARSLGAVFACLALFTLPHAAPGGPALATLAAWFAASLLAIAAIRGGAAELAGRVPGLHQAGRPAVIVGSGPQAMAFLDHLQQNPGHGHTVVGFFDDRSARDGMVGGRLPYLGDIRRMIDSAATLPARDVYVALPWSESERIAELMARLRYLPFTVRLLPDHLPPALPSNAPFALDGVVMPTLMQPPFTASDRAVKRAFDAVLACILLFLMLPLFAAVALLIKLDSPGPVFFRQVRSGQFGVGFRIFKFRSLHVGQADSRAETLVSRGDSRVTRVGRFLRKYSIDELPQILNVILGDMSLVGPRPHAPRAKADGQVYAEVMPDYPLRYRAKPGMTGWAQVNGWRGNTDTVEKLHRRVEFDFQYIEQWSLARDLYILLRTIPSVIAPPADNA